IPCHSQGIPHDVRDDVVFCDDVQLLMRPPGYDNFAQVLQKTLDMIVIYKLNQYLTFFANTFRLQGDSRNTSYSICIFAQE
ncbi:MAG: hypothetical protein J0I93_00715, partial [Legionella sp.]|nr:hypothetical protein [Legionella sp.]